MAAGTYDIVIDQGSDYALQIQVSQDGTNSNLNTHTARAQLRPSPTSTTKTADFTCSIVSASEGKIKMELNNTTTASIAAGKYYYDLELVNTSASTVTRLIQGVARVTAEVTR
jgi:ribosomal protein L1|tara:strand:- start:1055 stop:1393 length:339 start_codon:yes stop_codon:yes gene_type:complete